MHVEFMSFFVVVGIFAPLSLCKTYFWLHTSKSISGLCGRVASSEFCHLSAENKISLTGKSATCPVEKYFL